MPRKSSRLGIKAPKKLGEAFLHSNGSRSSIHSAERKIQFEELLRGQDARKGVTSSLGQKRSQSS